MAINTASDYISTLYLKDNKTSKPWSYISIKQVTYFYLIYKKRLFDSYHVLRWKRSFHQLFTFWLD